MSNQNVASMTEDAGKVNVPKIYYVHVVILFTVHLLNFMDRYTIPAVLHDVKLDFDMNDSEAGLLQTVFIVSFMLFSPLFGYLGDRYSRKLIMVAGIFMWSSSVLLSSFVPSHHYLLFLLCRACVGIGEASYITVAPTLIADLFAKDMRSNMLMFYNFALPVGSGLGFIIGSSAASALGSWRWGIRVTPLLSVVCVLLIIFVLEEPERGQSEKIEGHLEAYTYKDDLTALIHIPSYILSTIGYTCNIFVTGCLSWFTPLYVVYAVKSQGMYADDNHIQVTFGVLTCVSGLAGVTIGSNWAKRWRHTNGRADALVSAAGLLISVPLLFVFINTVDKIETLAWVIMFCGTTALSLNWSVIQDILMCIVVPQRRATATALQMLVSHLFGDAASPYLVGLISDTLRRDSTAQEHFLALRIALYINLFVLVLGGAFFLFTAWYIENDKFIASRIVTGLFPPPTVSQCQQMQENYGTCQK